MRPPESWPRCSAAAAFFDTLFRRFAGANPPVAAMAARFLDQAGVDLRSLIDHWTLPETPDLVRELEAMGLEPMHTEDRDPVWRHPHARLPRVRLDGALPAPRLALVTEELSRFVEANRLTLFRRDGDPDSRYQEARAPLPSGELAVVVRNGYDGFQPGTLSADDAARLAKARAALTSRSRSGEEAEVLARTQILLEGIITDLDPARAADEFFAAERAFYLTRNHAARWQYGRQQALGFGWANHDHHTYRSSRPAFRALTRLWNALGFVAREKFYAGAEAGWGAQIFEHPVSRVVLFCDVDVAPDEQDIDFAATDLPPRDTLGTIGLWCALHGGSIAGAGMHHLECEFDWERAAALLEAGGIGVMTPFTDLPMLKQAFTVAEMWPVAPERAAVLRDRGLITPEQAERFLASGAAGSHLEILQRWDGFKGFNKTGVSAIIRATDARG